MTVALDVLVMCMRMPQARGCLGDKTGSTHINRPEPPRWIEGDAPRSCESHVWQNLHRSPELMSPPRGVDSGSVPCSSELPEGVEPPWMGCCVPVFRGRALVVQRLQAPKRLANCRA